MNVMESMAVGDEGAAAALWTPTNATRMDEFRRFVNERHKLQLTNYQQLYDWSITNYSEFWETFWHYSKIIHSKAYTEVVDTSKRIDEVPEWFSGSRLNFAENLLRFRDDRVAFYLAGERELSTVTFAQLYQRVAEYAAAFRKIGVQKGDRIVGYIHNGREAVEAMLGAASIGAIWSSTSVDFGVTGVLDRFRQVQPKVIFAPSSVVYNGKVHDHMGKLSQVVRDLPQLSQVVVIPRQGETSRPDLSHIPNALYLDDFLALGREMDGTISQLEFEQLPFNHPLYIMYSSGTTGAPKCMVHSAGGTLIQHLKEHALHANLGRDDVLMFYTTTGWMMWNWLISALAVGASIVLYDGSPLYPSPSVIFDLIEKIGITVLGTSPKWLSVLEERGLTPAKTHQLSTLRAILSTGSTLAPSQFDYVYKRIKNDLMLGSITGGTDIVSCFALSNPSLPVYRGEIQCRGLGMAVQCWSQEEEHVEGLSGELVCVKPFPSAPVYFWNDPDGKKYKNAYFSQYEGVWCHGDFCLINPKTKGLVLKGRSDGTLNPNGVRFGSAEIYNIVNTFKEVEDSLCVPQFDARGNERVVLFLKMSDGYKFNKDIVDGITQVIRTQLSIRHVPAVFLSIPAIPYTINGKKVEIAVRQIIAGKQVSNTGVLADPSVLDLYKNIPELQGY